ncbi:MAG: RagB/SusD family nutrient uptake outer membrane protein [Prolixibacteraceae bacterium]|nr:RagB/SusD family nutrient uptake outer membrane protein [Prolixibacteraceae bacterium]
MKHILFKSLFMALLFSGCAKDLDLTPQDTISDASFWKTVADFKLGANNLYYSLEGLSFGDTESDIAYNTSNSISNGTYQPSETSDDWNTPYKYIRKCNNIIAKAASSSISEDVNIYSAEAKFFRAYNYWRLYRLYGGVPLIKEVLDLDSQALYGSRASRKETVDFILQDLTEAAIDLPLNTALAPADKGRISKGAAEALKARVALFEGTWGKYRGDANASEYLDIAITASGSVISSSQYSLYTEKANDSYRYLFIEEGDDSKEAILDRRYQKDIEGQVFPALIQRIGYLPTKKLADMYLCTDGLPITNSSLFKGYGTITTEFQNRDARMTMTIIIPGKDVAQSFYATPVSSWPFYPQRVPNTGYTTYKYISENEYANAQGESPNYSFDNHIIRYAEVLLIYAEALFEKNGSISDADLDKSINIIRQRVNMPALTNVAVSSNGLDMKTELRRERTVELAFENFRYDDLRRWKTAENELTQDIKGIKIVGTTWTDPVIIEGSNRNPYSNASWQSNTDADGFIIAESSTGRFFNPDKHYLRPLPTKEILINPKLEQNPNW